MKGLLSVVLLAVFLPGCSSVQSVDKIDGIVAVSGSERGVKLKVSHALQVWQPQSAADEVTLAPGEKLSFGDGYHSTTTVRYVGKKDGGFEFKVETIHRPPNEPKQREVRRLIVAPYGAAQPSVVAIADELRKALSQSWNVTLSNTTIRIVSKQDVWLLYPSGPPRETGESDDHYNRRTGFKTKFDFTLTFVPRLTFARLNQIYEERLPFEQMMRESANDKRRFTEAVNGLEKHPLPTFFTDDYSIFLESPYGAAGIHPAEAAERAEEVMGILRKLFDRSHVYPIQAESLAKDPVQAIREILPPSWTIVRVLTNTYPSYRPEGHGTGIFLGTPWDKNRKQDYSFEIYIMPRDYRDGGEDPTHGKAQSAPARLVAITKQAKVYFSTGSEEEWAEDLLKGLLGRPKDAKKL